MTDQPHSDHPRKYFLDAIETLYDHCREDTQKAAFMAAYAIVNKLGGSILIKPECRRRKSGIIEIAYYADGYRLADLYA